MVAQRAGGGAVSAAANTAAAAGAARTQDLSLLRRPRVFTVAIVWESAQVCAHPGQIARLIAVVASNITDGTVTEMLKFFHSTNTN